MLHEPLLALAVAIAAHADPPAVPALPAARPPRIHVVLAGGSRLPRLQLEHATAEATRLLAAAGIEVTWEAVPAGGAVDRVPPPLDVRIASCGDRQVPACSPGVLGRAISDGRPGGLRRAVVYADRIDALARPFLAARGTVLGRVLAHEIVHLLAGPGAHDDEGVMAAAWEARSVEDPLDAAAAFSDALRERLRRALAPASAGL